jgi:hypothetical protein
LVEQAAAAAWEEEALLGLGRDPEEPEEGRRADPGLMLGMGVLLVAPAVSGTAAGERKQSPAARFRERDTARKHRSSVWPAMYTSSGKGGRATNYSQSHVSE